MTSKIDGYKTSQAIAGAGVASVRSSGVEKSPGPAESSSADQITLTDSARSLQKLSEAVAQTPVVDSAKVESVKIALQQGTYVVDSKRVADKIIGFESLLK